MSKPAILALADGSIFRGESIGADGSSVGEVVFNTAMTGYQEMLTDPSYAGQIVMPTYPLIGNYGINDRDFESRRVQVAGFVVREHSLRPSHSLSTSKNVASPDPCLSRKSDRWNIARWQSVKPQQGVQGPRGPGPSRGQLHGWDQGIEELSFFLSGPYSE